MEEVMCPFDGYTHEVRGEGDEYGTGMDLTAHVLTYIYGLDPAFRGPDTPRGAYVWLKNNAEGYRLRCRVALSDLAAGFTGD